MRWGSARRTGASGARRGWKFGARRKVKYGCCAAGMCACVEGGASGQPSACSRSADPDDDVDARFPCCVRMWEGSVGGAHISGRGERPHLVHPRACTGCDDGGRGAHVEGVVPVSTGTDDIDDPS